MSSGDLLRGHAGFKGKSAYDIAVEMGFEGTKEEWLESLTDESLVKVEKSERIAAIETEKTNRTNADNNLQSQIYRLASGSPLAASSVSEMTDTNKVYVNTTDGHWYYYNGTSWVAGGVYQASVSNDDVSALNNNMKNYYNNINGTSGSSYTKKYIPYNFIEGVLYTLKIKFNEVHPLQSTTVINFSVKIKDDPDGNIVKAIIHNQYTDDMKNEYEVTFLAPKDANYIYLFQHFTAGQKYNYDLTITLPFGNTSLCENDFFYDEECFKLSKKNNTFGKKKTHNINYTRTANTQRDFIPFEFKSGMKYYITIKFNEYTMLSDGNTSAVNVRTTADATTSTVVEIISGDIITSEINSRLEYEFDCTQDANYLYLYTGFASGTNFNADIIILESYDNFSFSDDFLYDISNKQLKINNQKNYNYKYSGARIDLADKGFNCKQYMSITTPISSESVQGMAIFDGKLFQCQKKGVLNIYDLDNKISTPLASCNLGSYSTTGNHANCCNFSSKYYNNNTIPLLYVTGGNSGDVMECDVENIILSENDGEYSVTSELVQKITLDQSGFEEAGYVPYWGWSCWLTSPDNKYLFYFGAKYNTSGRMREYDDDNRYIVTKFHYPDINNSDVTLTADDVLEQFLTSYEIEYTQGGTLHNDKIYYSFGLGNANFPSKIGVWDIRNKSFVSVINLSNTSSPASSQEPEDVCVYNNKLYLMTVNKKLYELEFS